MHAIPRLCEITLQFDSSRCRVPQSWARVGAQAKPVSARFAGHSRSVGTAQARTDRATARRWPNPPPEGVPCTHAGRRPERRGGFDPAPGKLRVSRARRSCRAASRRPHRGPRPRLRARSVRFAPDAWGRSLAADPATGGAGRFCFSPAASRSADGLNAQPGASGPPRAWRLAARQPGAGAWQARAHRHLLPPPPPALSPTAAGAVARGSRAHASVSGGCPRLARATGLRAWGRAAPPSTAVTPRPRRACQTCAPR